MNTFPKLRDRQFSETYFPVGKFTEDHPEPASKKRKRGAGSPPEIPPHRRRRALAYLNPTLNYGTDSISYQWKDGKGRYINWKYVELDAGLTLPMAKAKANTTYDEWEIKRILTFNTDLAVAITRRRIVEFSKHADSATTPQLSELGVVYPEFAPLELCGDIVDDTVDEQRLIQGFMHQTLSLRPYWI